MVGDHVAHYTDLIFTLSEMKSHHMALKRE